VEAVVLVPDVAGVVAVKMAEQITEQGPQVVSSNVAFNGNVAGVSSNVFYANPQAGVETQIFTGAIQAHDEDKVFLSQLKAYHGRRFSDEW